jgi:hypothetical protein
MNCRRKQGPGLWIPAAFTGDPESWVASVLARFDERREFRECFPPAGCVVGDRHSAR